MCIADWLNIDSTDRRISVKGREAMIVCWRREFPFAVEGKAPMLDSPLRYVDRRTNGRRERSDDRLLAKGVPLRCDEFFRLVNGYRKKNDDDKGDNSSPF